MMCILLSACITDNKESNKQSEEDIYANDLARLGENHKTCDSGTLEINWEAISSKSCNWLSNYGLFDDLTDIQNSIRTPGIKYSLNSSLFSDYANKHRYLVLPEGTNANWLENDVFEFPTGTVIIKVFALPEQFIQNPSERIIEVRLQIKRELGWIFLPYVWHPELNDGYLKLSGKTISHYYSDGNVNSDFDYHIPTAESCKTCHQNKNGFAPIGPKARNLNKVINHENIQINQLQLWTSLGLLKGAPINLSTIDTMPKWTDRNHPIQDRAKAYLDINCAHCHSDHGTAALSGLRLEYWRKDLDYAHGVCNSSHGWRGGGFDIWPGEGEESSIPRRMNMTEAKDRMPPIGRTLIDNEAVELMEEWIDNMPYQDCGD